MVTLRLVDSKTNARIPVARNPRDAALYREHRGLARVSSQKLLNPAPWISRPFGADVCKGRHQPGAAPKTLPPRDRNVKMQDIHCNCIIFDTGEAMHAKAPERRPSRPRLLKNKTLRFNSFSRSTPGARPEGHSPSGNVFLLKPIPMRPMHHP